MSQLVQCKACGGEVARSARACPKCGAPPPKSVSVIKLLAVGLLAFTCIGLVGSSQKKKEQQAQEVATAAPIDVTADALEAAYETNEIAADDRYKGLVLRVSGVADSIDKDVLDHPVVYLRSKRALLGVRCAFDDQHKAALSGIRKGQKVTLRGRGDGYLLGSPTMRDCMLE